MYASRALGLLVFLLISLAGCTFNDLSQRLKDRGVTATATILEIWETGTTINDDPVIGMRVEVKPLRQPPFRATIDWYLVSIIHIPQYQPGKTIPVRFDPDDPTVIAVDTGTGNPYHDHFMPTNIDGDELEEASPATPSLYAGTSSLDDDYVALLENGYAIIGASIVEMGGEDPQLAVRQGAELGAVLVVVYGSGFTTLTELPFRKVGSPDDESLLKRLPLHEPDSRIATFWAKAK